jgi:hypothetical protein
MKKEKLKSTKIDKIEKINNYNGKVYDLMVEDDHSYVVTKNNYISHNSAVEYFPSQVIDVGKGKIIKSEFDTPIGLEVRVRIAKSRFFVPFVTARVQIYFDRGFEPTSGLFEMLEQAGAILKVSQAGWWQFKDQIDKEKKYRETEIFDLIKADINKYLTLIDNVKVSAAGVDGIEYSEKKDELK